MDVLVYKVPVVLPGGNDTVTKNIVIGIYYPEKSNITNRYLLGTYKLFDFYNKLTPLQLSLYNNKPVIIANGGKTVNVTAAVTQIDNLLKNQDSEKSKKALDEQQLNKLYLFLSELLEVWNAQSLLSIPLSNFCVQIFRWKELIISRQMILIRIIWILFK